MIGSPCHVGTADAGTLSVTYTNRNDGTDSVSIVCDQGQSAGLCPQPHHRVGRAI